MRQALLVSALLGCVLGSVACGDVLSSIFGGDDDHKNGDNGNPDDTNNAPFGSIDFDAGMRDASNDGNCTPDLTGIVRDFKGINVSGGHPDFEAYSGSGPTKGLVQKKLGADRKPVFASTNGDDKYGQQITSKESFDQWYRNVDGVNIPFEYVLPLKPTDNGILSFSSNAFFPIDGKGWGNSGEDDNGVEHNFHFTFELHLQFVYNGGEVFTFTGDDDLWTFFNGNLGIDLGGLHPARSATVNLDDVAAELGITKGNTYPLDVFQAERHTTASNFRIDTTLEFVNCNPILLPK